MSNLIYAGLDFSLTSPALTIHCGTGWSSDQCHFYYLTKTKKYQIDTDVTKGITYGLYSNEMDRYTILSDFAINQLSGFEKIYLTIEGYSYGSTGKVFEIGESTGILKWRLLQNNINHNIVPPKTIKKFATGSGDATKEHMYEKFLIDTGIDLCYFLKKESISSPISDIVDSYFICKYGYFNRGNK